MIEINGQKVKRGDIIVLMASPDAGSAQRKTDAFCIVTHDRNTETPGIAEVPFLVLRELLSEADRHALLDAVRERRALLESGNALGIFALIWKRPVRGQREAVTALTPRSIYNAMSASISGDSRGVGGTVDPHDWRAVNAHCRLNFEHLAALLNGMVSAPAKLDITPELLHKGLMLCHRGQYDVSSGMESTREAFKLTERNGWIDLAALATWLKSQ